MRTKRWHAERGKRPPEGPAYVGPPVKVGDWVTRRPISFTDYSETRTKKAREMTGQVVYIHPKGRFHLVEFRAGNNTLRECFFGVREERS